MRRRALRGELGGAGDDTLRDAGATFDGGSANSWSFPPKFTGNGRQVLFQSWASDLAGFDFNQSGDVFAYAMFYVGIAPGGSPASGPILSWPVEPGKTYHVQFRDDLNIGIWQDAGGTVTIVNDWAYFTDPSSASGQRFYRIVAN